MFSSTMIEDLVKSANHRIVETMSKTSVEILSDKRYSHISILDIIDMRAFIGLTYLLVRMGVP